MCIYTTMPLIDAWFQIGLTGADGLDDLPYTTLGYLNGPGGEIVQDSYEQTGNRPNLTDVDTGTTVNKGILTWASEAYIPNQPNSMILVSFSSAEDALINDVKNMTPFARKVLTIRCCSLRDTRYILYGVQWRS